MTSLVFILWCSQALGGTEPARPEVVDVGTDPQLFLDDYLVARSEGLQRKVHAPARMPRPVLPQGPEVPKYLANFHTVIYDASIERFRLWYNGGSSTWYAESADGIAWGRPRCLWPYSQQGNRGYVASVLRDDQEPDLARRFKHASWQTPAEKSPEAWRRTGTYIAWSADGLAWVPYEHNPVLPGRVEGPDKQTVFDVFDHTDLAYDPVDRHYCLFVRLGTMPSEKGRQTTRLVGQSISKDFLHWDKPWRIHAPDEKDAAGLEFYGQGANHVRGSLRIAMVRVLHDNLKADDPPDPPKAFGIGYSVLSYSRDGRTWTRYREPLLDRNPEKGSFDHAHAWINSVVPVGKRLHIYYAGYEKGHKVGLRQIGLATLRRDGYVSLDAGVAGGSLQTPPLRRAGSRLVLNAEVEPAGEIRVEIQDRDGRALPGYAARDADPIRGDDVELPATWRGKSDLPLGQPIRLKVVMRSARLYAFQFQ